MDLHLSKHKVISKEMIKTNLRLIKWAPKSVLDDAVL